MSIDTPNNGFHVEREVQNLKLKNSMLEEFSDNIKKQLQDAEESLQKSRHEYYDALQARDKYKFDNDTLNDEVKRLKDEKLDLFEMLKKKNCEITQLKTTLQNIQAIGVTDNDFSQNNIKLKEIEHKFLETRLENEKKLYEERLENLTNDLTNKTDELMNCRKEKNESVLEATMKIEEQANEINNLRMEVNRFRKMVESKDSANEELSKKLLELQVNCTELEGTFQKETEAQNEVINLMMKRNKDLTEESKSKDQNIEELREMLKKGYLAHQELEDEFKTMKESYINDVKELEGERNELAQELERTKMCVAEMSKANIEREFERHFPFASETNRQLNNRVNLSDLYDELVRAKQDLAKAVEKQDLLQSENDALREKIDQDKPVFYQHMHQFKEVAESNEKLENEVLQLTMEKDKYVAEKDEDTRLINTLQREIKRYDSENKSLSLQISHLLKSIQEAKGFNVSFTSTNSQTSSDLESGIVLFKDIQELQDRNRQLLSLLHQMNEQVENKDFGNENVLVIDLENRLNECQKENHELRLELTKKMEIAETASKHSINSSGNSLLDSMQVMAENKELKAKVEKYIEEIDRLHQRNLEEIRRLENDKNTLIAEKVDLGAKYSTVNSELEAKKQYVKDIDLTLEKFQNENASLRERNIKLNANVQILEKNVLALSNKNDALSETIKQKDSALEFAKKATLEAKTNADNFMRESARLSKELENQRKLVESLKVLQDNCNKIENDSIRSQAEQINHLQKEIMYYREKIEKQEEKWKKTLEDFSTRFHNQQVMLDKERNNYLQLQEQYFELKLNSQPKMPQPSETNVERISNVEGEASTGQLKKELKTTQDEVKILKGKLINSEEACENLKSINTALEENLNQLMKNSDEIRNNIDSERQNKLDTINRLNQELQSLRSQYDQIVEEKNSEIFRLKESAATLTLQVEEVKRALTEANETIENARCNEQQVLADLKMQSLIAARAQENYEKELQQRSEDATTIFELKLNLEQLQKSLTATQHENTKAREELTLAKEAIANERKTLSDEFDKLRTRCNQLEQVNGTLVNQIDVLNNQLIALQNNSNLYLMDENHQKENASNLLSVIKFLREEKTQLQSKMSKLTDEDMCLKIEIENLKREINTLKLSLQNERQSTNRLNNLNEFNELVAKAEMVPTLSESNAQLRTQVNQLEKKCKELLEKVNLHESKEKSLHDLSNKAEDHAVQNEFLKKQILELKQQVKSYSQQLKGFDADSLKRVMSEKANLNRQVQLQLNEVNKLKQELETKTRSLLLNEQELNSIKQRSNEDNENLNKEISLLQEKLNGVEQRNNQLKHLALRYKKEIDTLKSGQNTTSASFKPTVTKADKEVQSDPVASDSFSSTTSEDTLKELESKLGTLNNEVQRIREENETLKKHASEKEDVAKKIAQQAKQRLSDLAQEKNGLIKEKDERVKEIQELKSKISQLESSAVENDHYLTLLKTQVEQHVKELEVANKQIEDLTVKLDQVSSNENPSRVVAPPVVTTVAAKPDTVMTANPSTNAQWNVGQSASISTVALTSVLNATKTTPTASIKPMAVTSTRSSTTFTRPGQVFAKVMPTSNEVLEDESTLVPQATVQPTQTIVTSASSTGITSSLPSTYQQSFIEISEASTSQAQQSSLLNQPSTSGVNLESNKKRVLDTFDEPSSSNCKKIKNDSKPIVVELEEESFSDVDVSVDDRAEDEKTDNEVIHIEDDEHLENLDENQDENQVDSGSEDKSDEIEIIEPELQQQEFEDEERSFEEIENEFAEDAYENYAMPTYMGGSENAQVESDNDVECIDDDEDGDEEEEDDDEEDDEMEDEEDMDEEEGEEEAEMEDEEEEEDYEGSGGGDGGTPIEVISIDDSDDDQPSSNKPATTSTRQVPDEVSSSHSSSSQRGQSSSHLSTTTNDDGSEVPQSNQPEQAGPSTSMDTVAAHSSRFQVSNSAEVVTSQSSLGTVPQANTTEQASSTSSQTQRVPRRPVLWPQSHNTAQPSQQQQHSQRGRPQTRPNQRRGFRRNFR